VSAAQITKAVAHLVSHTATFFGEFLCQNYGAGTQIAEQ